MEKNWSSLIYVYTECLNSFCRKLGNNWGRKGTDRTHVAEFVTEEKGLNIEKFAEDRLGGSSGTGNQLTLKGWLRLAV